MAGVNTTALTAPLHSPRTRLRSTGGDCGLEGRKGGGEVLLHLISFTPGDGTLGVTGESGVEQRVECG